MRALRSSSLVALLSLAAVGLTGDLNRRGSSPGSAVAFAADAQASTTENITLYRDEFGVPHIFADTEEGACYGLGYAQAEDRLEELLRQYRRAEGTMSEVYGPAYLDHDRRQRLWQHRAISEARYKDLSPKARAMIEAFQAGIKHYMNEHPGEVPAWAPKLEPWQVVALGRLIIWGWPEGTAGGDLKRGGIKPDPVEPRGSNQWVIAANRTTLGAPIALVDPHLSWYGPFRFYECRMYGGDLAVSGMAIVGLPEISLGHNRYLSFAKTTGGPDTSDAYEEEINPDNPRQYRYDGQWRNMTARTETIRVKEGDKLKELKFELEYTHHGPVVARQPGKAYTLKLSYSGEVHLLDQNHAMLTARNLSEFKRALSTLQLMEQNVMCATVQGDIYYVRNGRVPIRAKGYDYHRPIAGNTSKTEWLGIHPFADLVQIANPPQGYMQNCNVSPQFMMKDCPLTPDRWTDRPELFNGYVSAGDAHDNGLHQRAAMAVELLHNNKRVTLEDAVAIAMSPAVWGADLWQARLSRAWENARGAAKDQPDARQLKETIIGWDRRCDAGSVGAIAYRYWKDQLGDAVRRSDRAGRKPPDSVTDDQLMDALAKGAAQLQKDWGRLDVAYGDVYRTGRRDYDVNGEPNGKPKRTFPVAGGSVPSLATPRAIGFDPRGDGKTFLAHSGQTSPQVIVLSNPPRSFTVTPLGQSDHPDSPHYDDQAEKLFSQGKLKPTYFLNKADLEAHAASRTVLRRAVGHVAAN